MQLARGKALEPDAAKRGEHIKQITNRIGCACRWNVKDQYNSTEIFSSDTSPIISNSFYAIDQPANVGTV